MWYSLSLIPRTNYHAKWSWGPVGRIRTDRRLVSNNTRPYRPRSKNKSTFKLYLAKTIKEGKNGEAVDGIMKTKKSERDRMPFTGHTKPFPSGSKLPLQQAAVIRSDCSDVSDFRWRRNCYDTAVRISETFIRTSVRSWEICLPPRLQENCLRGGNNCCKLLQSKSFTMFQFVSRSLTRCNWSFSKAKGRKKRLAGNMKVYEGLGFSCIVLGFTISRRFSRFKSLLFLCKAF